MASSARCDARNVDEGAHPNRVSSSARTCWSSTSPNRSGVSQASDAAFVQHGDAGGQRERFGQIVRHEQDGARQLRLQRAELAVQFDARDRIERAERLVHQEHRRIGGERARQADALPLTAGQLIGPARAELRWLQANQREQLVDAGRDAIGGPLEQTRHDGDVVRHGEVREKADVLNGVAGLPAERDRVPVVTSVPDTCTVAACQRRRVD